MLLPRADQPKLANNGSDIAALRMMWWWNYHLDPLDQFKHLVCTAFDS